MVSDRWWARADGDRETISGSKFAGPIATKLAALVQEALDVITIAGLKTDLSTIFVVAETQTLYDTWWP